MNYQVFFVIFGLVGAIKILYDIPVVRRTILREEFKFGHDCLDKIGDEDQMRPYLREKGYQAIAGDRYISADEVVYLLTLYRPEPNFDSGRYRRSDGALRDYLRGKRYLVFHPEGRDTRIEFKEKYKREWSRKWRKTLYLSMASFFVMVPILLIFSNKHFPKMASNLWETSLTILIFFGAYFLIFLKLGSDIYGAEYLVKHQKDRMLEVPKKKSQATIALRDRGLRKRNKKF